MSYVTYFTIRTKILVSSHVIQCLPARIDMILEQRTNTTNEIVRLTTAVDSGSVKKSNHTVCSEITPAVKNKVERA